MLNGKFHYTFIPGNINGRGAVSMNFQTFQQGNEFIEGFRAGWVSDIEIPPLTKEQIWQRGFIFAHKLKHFCYIHGIPERKITISKKECKLSMLV